jgi:hypothetical protein
MARFRALAMHGKADALKGLLAGLRWALWWVRVRRWPCGLVALRLKVWASWVAAL